MIEQLFGSPLLFAVNAISLVIAITVHEFAHAISADKLGDPTPRLQGRVTLNPAKHLDPLGTLLIFIVGFGWGRPVEFDPFNLRDMRKDAAIISFAGPLSNIVMAALTTLIAWILISMGIIEPVVGNVFNIASALFGFIYMNIALAVFNMIPIHPLDGFKIVGGLLSKEAAHQWYQLERYGWILLLVVILPIAGNNSVIDIVVRPVTRFLVGLFAWPLLG